MGQGCRLLAHHHHHHQHSPTHRKNRAGARDQWSCKHDKFCSLTLCSGTTRRHARTPEDPAEVALDRDITAAITDCTGHGRRILPG